MSEQARGDLSPKKSQTISISTFLPSKDLMSSTHFLLVRGTLQASPDLCSIQGRLGEGHRFILTKVRGSSGITNSPSMAQSRTSIRGSRGPGRAGRKATPCTTGRLSSMLLLTASL